MKEFLETFFSGLGISVTSLEVREDGEDLSIRVETPDSALLIGMHGKNIESFQHLIGRYAERKLKKFIHVHLEVNDYMKAKDERLFRFLDGKIDWVMSSGKTVQIKNLSSFERKKAHNYIAEMKLAGLTTKSEGEGENRMLILNYSGTLKSPSLPPVSTKPSAPLKESKSFSALAEDGVGI